MARDCLVKFNKDTLITPKKVKTFDDVEVDTRPNGQTRYKAKTKSEPVWVVSIDMPRRYVDEFSKDVVEIDSNKFVDMEDVKLDDENIAPQITQPEGLL